MLREPEALRQPADVRVDDDPLRLPAFGRDDVRGLSAHARQANQVLETLRHLAVVLLEQHPHGGAEVPGLLPERPRRTDVRLELLEGHRQVVLGPVVLAEEAPGHTIHRDVGRLGREHHADEKLDGIPEAECDCGVRVRLREAGDDLVDAFPLRSHATAGLADVATRGRESHPGPVVGWHGGSWQASKATL